MCICGHEAVWHDGCSKCYCPFFLANDADVPEPIKRAWQRGRKDRERREKGRD